MWVKFYSDATTNQAGFAATIQTEDPVCGGIVSINETTSSQVKYENVFVQYFIQIQMYVSDKTFLL